MSEQETKSKARRQFFRVASLGIGAAGAAALGLRAGSGEAKANAGESGSRKGKPVGYQHSAHVKRYYELARF